MKSYPSISKIIRQDLHCFCFSKIDGSNIRAEWNNKKGFYKFGTRTQLIDINSQPFGKSIDSIKNKFEGDLSRIFNKLNYKSAVAFFEYFGPSSQFGSHNFEENMDIKLIDINPLNIGLLPPEKYMEDFGHLDIASLVYEGCLTDKIIDDIKSSAMPNMAFEGVVVKATERGKQIMFKIKTNAWLNKLKEHCNGDDNLFEKLM